MRLSTSIGNLTPSVSAIACASSIMARATARVPVVGDDLVQRAAGQRRDRVEGEVAPELDPDLVADVGADRRLQPGRDQLLARAACALGLLARRLAEREAVAVDMADDAGRLDLGRGIDDAADRALRPDALPR